MLTDRSIYRPGQTVRVAAIVYEQTGKTSHRVVAGESIKFALRDANNKIVSEQKATTDEFGTATTDFLLPTSGLTGRFTIVAVGVQPPPTSFCPRQDSLGASPSWPWAGSAAQHRCA